eukprot:TRINITY_DN2195_c0_g1_i1.p1 TRINITY_DN2195_c0_g1~~TRINITY_DN2195_c0_g1_i1.p1  ORF type:complete len:262 (+),score=55.46 TRINITY_DN2195_c0_g1_i1:46-831(+)
MCIRDRVSTQSTGEQNVKKQHTEDMATKRKDADIDGAGTKYDAGPAKKFKTGEGISYSSYRTNPEFLTALIHTRVEQLKLPENKVFVAERTDKIVDVYKGLVKHNFLSVPVLQQTGHKYYGFVEVTDIISFILGRFEKEKLNVQTSFWDLVATEEDFLTKTVDDIMVSPRRNNMFHPVRGGYSLYYAIEALAKERDLHRVAVIDNNRLILNLITQSHIVEFLYKNIDKIDKVNKPLHDIPGLFRQVFSINTNDEAIMHLIK